MSRFQPGRVIIAVLMATAVGVFVFRHHQIYKLAELAKLDSVAELGKSAQALASADGEVNEITNISSDSQKVPSVSSIDIPVPAMVVPSSPATMEDRPFVDVPPPRYNRMEFRIYSHNVKNGGHQDLVAGERPWNERVDEITQSIKSHAPPNTIVTLQEVYSFQLDDIMTALTKDQSWHAYGVGRIDGKSVGEFVPIIWRPTEWELVYNDTVWLNENSPRVAVEGWDAKYLRIVSYVTLKHKATGNHINMFNTHLDHVGLESRQGSAKQIIALMESINHWPSFLCGDLNCERSEQTYGILTERLQDSQRLATDDNWYGHRDSSVTGFTNEVVAAGGQNIDYIFSPKYATGLGEKCVLPAALCLERWGMLESKFGQYYMSDHRPLVGDFTLDKCDAD